MNTGGNIAGLGANLSESGEQQFYPMLMPEAKKVWELLPKVDVNAAVLNTVHAESYQAMLELIRIAMRQPDAKQEDIESWLDVRTAKVAMKTLLDLPII